MAMLNLINQKFGKLTVVEHLGRDKSGKHKWRCACDCGQTKDTWTWHLTAGKERQCSQCVSKQQGKALTLHGGSRSKLYQTWADMIQRCTNPNNTNYIKYGAKGITVCEDWMKFDAFQAWALANGYAVGLTIDRIDSADGYAPDNCRWLSQRENSRLGSVSRWAKVKPNGFIGVAYG